MSMSVIVGNPKAGSRTLAADHGWEADETLESYSTVRHDGSRRAFAVPRMPLPDPDLEIDDKQETRA